MKKKARRGVLIVCLALLLCMVNVVSVFAGPATSIQVYSKYKIGTASTSGYISVINGSITNNLGITSGQTGYSVWLPGRLNADVKLYANFTVGASTQYVMCYKSATSKIGLSSEYSALASYSQIDFHTLNASAGQYRLYMRGLNKYLASGGSTINVLAYSETSTLQRWYVTT